MSGDRTPRVTLRGEFLRAERAVSRAAKAEARLDAMTSDETVAHIATKVAPMWPGGDGIEDWNPWDRAWLLELIRAVLSAAKTEVQA